MTAIKICGVTTPGIARLCRSLAVDHIGLVFAARSARKLAPDAAAEIASAAPELSRVGLFVDPANADIDAALPAITAIQLHGEEPPERCAEIRARIGLPVWKAIGVSSRADVAAASAWREACDLALFDTKAPPGAVEGGRGVRFDWALLASPPPVPVWGLAGGLSPANVGRAMGETNAPLVDVSTGVEEAPGIKSPEAVRAFVQAVRTA
ncbi:MAG: phosphoribosylanthranilate isomerase [Pacificimonas sp.]|jgi:phosphoribosylanthranilate isomerase|nr:phosphoribosylanthranilate isomerase [Pacificimonas sp.]